MAKEFVFPDVGEGIHEGVLVKWLVKEGDKIEEHQNIAEIETDKAVVEIPSPYGGFVLKLNFKQGETVKVGQVLMAVGDKGEKYAATSDKRQVAKKKKAPPRNPPKKKKNL